MEPCAEISAAQPQISTPLHLFLVYKVDDKKKYLKIKLSQYKAYLWENQPPKMKPLNADVVTNILVPGSHLNSFNTFTSRKNY